MQAGKVDVPSACKVCGANLSDDRADTCGSICAGALKRRRVFEALSGSAPGDRAIIQHEGNQVVDVLVLRQSHRYFNITAIGSLLEIARIRAKIATVKLEDRCGPTCATWAVFNADSAPELDVCIDCWSGAADPLTLDEVEALPEAEHELALAVAAAEVETDAETLLYKHPLVSPLACECGYFVFHVEGEQQKCSACAAMRRHECHCAVPGSCAICAPPNLLDVCRALRHALALVRDGKPAELEGLIAETDEIIALYEEAAPPASAVAELLHAAMDSGDMKYVAEARKLVSTQLRVHTITELLEAQGYTVTDLAAATVARLRPRWVVIEGASKVPPAPPLGRDEPLFRAVLDAMDRAEEINGPEGDDYRRLMRAIEDEARSRRQTFDKDESPVRPTVALANCGNPGETGRATCLGNCTLHPKEHP